MSIREKYKCKAKELEMILAELNSKLEELYIKIIIKDIESNINTDTKIKNGINKINDLSWLDQIHINGKNITFIDKKKSKYMGYTLYLEKEFCTIGLGFEYNGDLISPHIEDCVMGILRKYSNDEDIENIINIIEDAIKKIHSDLDMLQVKKDVEWYEHSYKNYSSGGFEGETKFDTIQDVINDFREKDM